MPYTKPSIEWPHRIAFVGEAEGETEKCMGDAFQGPAGFILDNILEKIGLPREAVMITNVFKDQPPQNKLSYFTEKKTKLHVDFPFNCPLPVGGYLSPIYWPHVYDLFRDLKEFSPELIFCLGATALWALTGRTDIGTARATLVESLLGPIIPTFHPSSVLQGSYANRVIIRADLEKGLRWLQNPLTFKKKRTVFIPSSLKNALYLKDLLLTKDELACDIETCQGLIDMIGFAWDSSHSVIFPFAETRLKGKSWQIVGPYWPSSYEFIQVWRMVQEVLEQGGKVPCPIDHLSDRLPNASSQIYHTIRRLYR